MDSTEERRFPRLAVLIDGDNVSPSHIDAVLTAARGLGTVHIRRVYGTKDHLRGWLSKSQAHDIQAREVGRAKNAADAALMDDCRRLLAERSLSGFVIVSSDRHFTSLVRELKSANLAVYGFGKRTARATLRDACDRFFCVEDFSPSRKRSVGAAGSPKPGANGKTTHRCSARHSAISGAPPARQQGGRQVLSARKRKRQEWDLRRRLRRVTRVTNGRNVQSGPARPIEPFFKRILAYLGQLPAHLVAVAVSARPRDGRDGERSTAPPNVQMLLTRAYHAAPKRRGGWVDLGRLAVAANKLCPGGRFREIRNGRFGLLVQRCGLFDIQGGPARPGQSGVRGNFMVKLRARRRNPCSDATQNNS